MKSDNQIISGSFVHDIKTIIAHAVHGDCENEENPGYYFISFKDLEPYKVNYQSARQITYELILDSLMPYFKTISEAIYTKTFENQQLSSLRDWLLPMLMNGQVTVGDRT